MSCRTKPKFPTAIWAYQNLPAQNIPNAVQTQVRLDGEEFDALDEFDAAAYTFTPRYEGYYHVIASLRWATTAALSFRRGIIILNGANVALNEVWPAAIGQIVNSKCEALVHMTPNDVLRIDALQQSGGGEAFAVGAPVRDDVQLFIHRVR